MKISVSTDFRRDSGFHLKADFSVETRSLALIGPSGSGKSTLLEMIAGIEPGAAVALNGADISSHPPELRRVGYVPQEGCLFPHLSVRENLLFAPRAKDPQEVARALDLESLLERTPKELSGGEKRRVALGRAILSEPELLLLDEPFAGLDAERRRAAMSLLLESRTRFDIPMIFVSHDASEVIGLCDDAVRLEEGRAVFTGPALEALDERDMAIDNFLEGTAEPGGVRCGGVLWKIPGVRESSGKVRFGVYARDVLLASERPKAISARNVFDTKVRSVCAAGGKVVVELEAGGLKALVTENSAEALGLRPGAKTTAIIKATAVEILSR